MLTAILFIFITCFLYVLAFARGPVWALLAYVNIYFNAPDPSVNWWASYLPLHNWSYLTTAVLLTAMFYHRRLLSDRGFKVVYFIFFFVVLTYLITFTIAQYPEEGKIYAYMLLSYAIACFAIVKIIRFKWQFRLLWLSFICFAANLSLNAYLHGKRIHSRLEHVGTADSNGSNEFALLLAGVIPLLIPFLLKGKRYEKVICLLCMPFLLNAFVLCNSRGAAVALAVSFFVATFFVAEKKMRKKMIVVGILLLAGIGYLADEAMIKRMSSLLHTEEAMSDESFANTLSSGRMEIWGYGLKMVNDFPFGAGPNGFKKLARFYMPDEVLTFRPGAAYGVRAAHNSYLEVLVEQGYFGLIVWLILCGYTLLLIYSSFLALKKLKTADPFWLYCVFAMAVSFLSILLGSLFNSRVYYEFFWWQIAMTVVLESLVKEMRPGLHAEKEVTLMSEGRL